MGEKKKITKTEEEWLQELTPEQYHILRKKGTEPAFSGQYNHHKEEGVYCCAGCGNELFVSDAKFDSGSGWPSYTKPLSKKSVETKPDRSLGTERTEVICGRCGSHLGHVFDDGSKPAGKRFCINSVALQFRKRKV